MRSHGRIALLVLCLLLVPVSVGAADYKAWIPLLPNTLGGLTRSGEPDGFNMEMSGQSWSSLNQDYSSGSKNVTLTIVSGMVAPQAQTFQMMQHMEMESGDEILKTTKVSGYKAIFQFDKGDKKGSLMIAVNQQTFVVIEEEPCTGEKELVALAKDVPLGKIAAQGNN